VLVQTKCICVTESSYDSNPSTLATLGCKGVGRSPYVCHCTARTALRKPYRQCAGSAQLSRPANSTGYYNSVLASAPHAEHLLPAVCCVQHSPVCPLPVCACLACADDPHARHQAELSDTQDTSEIARAAREVALKVGILVHMAQGACSGGAQVVYVAYTEKQHA